MKPCVTGREGSGRMRLLTNRLELHPTSFDLLAGGEFPFPFASEYMGALTGAGSIGPSVGHLDRVRLAGCLDQVGLGPQVALAAVVAETDQDGFAGRSPNGG